MTMKTTNHATGFGIGSVPLVGTLKDSSRATRKTGKLVFAIQHVAD
jgi:hypothetical protein